MKIKFKQRWQTIPPISTKWTVTTHINSLNTERPRHMTLKIQVQAWDRHKNVAELNRLMESQPPL